jgi:hypothetical protein
MVFDQDKLKKLIKEKGIEYLICYDNITYIGEQIISLLIPQWGGRGISSKSIVQLAGRFEALYPGPMEAKMKIDFSIHVTPV